MMTRMTSKGDLINKLRETIDKFKHEKKLLTKVKDDLFKYGIPKGETQRIIMGDVPLEELENRKLILFSISINGYFKDPEYGKEEILGISPYGTFLKEEIEEVVNSMENLHIIDNEVEIPIVIKRTRKSGDDGYTAYMPISQLVSLYNKNVLEYNYNINRQYKFVKNVQDKLIQTIDINLNEVRRIAEKINNNTYEFTEVTLNVLKGSNPEGREVEYDDSIRELRIYNSKIDIINGLHDINAMAYVMESNPNCALLIEVEIKNFSLEDIKNYFNKLNIKGSVN